MILIAGLPNETPLRLVINALEQQGAAHVVLNQVDHEFTNIQFQPSVETGLLEGTLELPGLPEIDLRSFSAVYQRLHSAASIEELNKLPVGHASVLRFNRQVQMLTLFADFCDGRVLNRTAGMVTNNSKPYQAQLIKSCGFGIPKTLITNDPEQAQDFIAQNENNDKDTIYKSASSVRSIVKTIASKDFERLHRLRICPVQFQERVPGMDVRVHTVGQTVFASAIETTGVDYRYANSEENGSTKITEYELPEDIQESAIRLSQLLDLPLSGIDLRKTPDDEWYCFEVNPSPAYSYYEENTGQAISTEIANYLIGSRG